MTWFWDLSGCRTHDQGAPNPITPAAFRDWMAITGIPLTRDEISILRAMDRAYRSALAEEREAQIARMREEAKAK